MSNPWKLVLLFLLSAAAFGALTWYGIGRVVSQSDAQKLFVEGKTSFITGTSRAAKLSAEALNQAMNDQSEVYNYAFNLTMSSYGPLYYQSITGKLDASAPGKPNIYVVCIDPWAVSASIANPEDSTLFRENPTQINFDSKQRFARARYFFRYFENPFYTLLLPTAGEALAAVRPEDAFVASHVKAKLEAYRSNNFVNNTLSSYRYKYFERLIETLQQHGAVYLTRLPVAEEMILLETEFSPGFDSLLSVTSKKYEVPLIDFYPIADQFLCPDGNHLFDEDAVKVSQMIGQIISLHKRGELATGENLLEQYLELTKPDMPLTK